MTSYIVGDATYILRLQSTVFICIEAWALISFKQLLTRCLYEPFRILYGHLFTLECIFSGPCVYMSPAFIQIKYDITQVGRGCTLKAE